MIEIDLPENVRANEEIERLSLRDLSVLKHMARKICTVLHTIEPPTAAWEPQSFTLERRHQRPQAITILNAEHERRAGPLAFVAFVGERRLNVDPQVQSELFQTDAALTRELATMPGLLYYSSLQLSSEPERWYNLVVLAHADAQSHLRQSAAHRYAAYQLAPGYYQWIRLHHGSMPEGLNGPLILRKTRHFTNADQEPRFTVRELTFTQKAS